MYLDFYREIDNINLHKLNKHTVFIQSDIDILEKVDIEEIIEEEIDMLDLKDNFLPKGLTPLEDLFYSNDVPKKPKMEPVRSHIEECNIGIELKPKMIKLYKSLPPWEKEQYINILNEYQDVFAWSYEDLKPYDTNIIQHKIPIKDDKKPFKQKLRRINLFLLPLIEKEVKHMYDAQIIAPTRYSDWVSNLVPTRNKTMCRL